MEIVVVAVNVTVVVVVTVSVVALVGCLWIQLTAVVLTTTVMWKESRRKEGEVYLQFCQDKTAEEKNWVGCGGNWMKDFCTGPVASLKRDFWGKKSVGCKMKSLKETF